MKQVYAPLFALALAASPAAAQDTDAEGRSLMERGVELFFEGLKQEMEPTVDELRGLAEQFGPSMRSFIEEMGPALTEMFAEVRDWTAYHPPEMLPNGDIILRKRRDSDPEPGDTDAEEPSGPTDI